MYSEHVDEGRESLPPTAKELQDERIKKLIREGRMPGLTQLVTVLANAKLEMDAETPPGSKTE
jgi:hypothetical protein